MTGKYYRIYILANYAELYLGWNYSSIISLLGFRKAFLGFSTQYLIVFRRAMFVIPTGMQYGDYLPPDRYTGDQVPWQNMHVTQTVHVRGARSVQITEEIGDAKQRFATLQVTGQPSTHRISLCTSFFTHFHGKPTKGDPTMKTVSNLHMPQRYGLSSTSFCLRFPSKMAAHSLCILYTILTVIFVSKL